MIPERTVKKQWRQLKIMWIYVKTSLATKKNKVKIWNFSKVKYWRTYITGRTLISSRTISTFGCTTKTVVSCTTFFHWRPGNEVVILLIQWMCFNGDWSVVDETVSLILRGMNNASDCKVSGKKRTVVYQLHAI